MGFATPVKHEFLNNSNVDDILCQVSLRSDINFTKNYLDQKP